MLGFDLDIKKERSKLPTSKKDNGTHPFANVGRRIVALDILTWHALQKGFRQGKICMADAGVPFIHQSSGSSYLWPATCSGEAWRSLMSRLFTYAGFAGFLAILPADAFDKLEEHNKRFIEAGSVLTEVMQAPDKGIPQDLLGRAHCVAIVPGLKRVGFIVGAKYGKGVLTCRTTNSWSAPSTIRIEGGSIGFQIGAGETDLVLLVMNERGKEKLLDDKFTVGGDASVMGGPVGRSASAATDAQLHAEMLSYSRARGVFAGVSLEGATLRPDTDDNHDVYGPDARQSQIITGKYTPTASAASLLSKLNSYSPAEKR